MCVCVCRCVACNIMDAVNPARTPSQSRTITLVSYLCGILGVRVIRSPLPTRNCGLSASDTDLCPQVHRVRSKLHLRRVRCFRYWGCACCVARLVPLLATWTMMAVKITDTGITKTRVRIVTTGIQAGRCEFSLRRVHPVIDPTVSCFRLAVHPSRCYLLSFLRALSCFGPCMRKARKVRASLPNSLIASRCEASRKPVAHDAVIVHPIFHAGARGKR